MELAQMSPYNWRLLGINMAKVFIGGFVFYIKCDKRPFPTPFPDIVFSPNRPIVIIARQMEGSNDLMALKPALDRYRAFRQRTP